MKTQLTRRELAALAVAPPALAQAVPADDELKAAAGRRQKQSEELAKYPVPMSAEPAFVFKP